MRALLLVGLLALVSLSAWLCWPCESINLAFVRSNVNYGEWTVAYRVDLSGATFIPDTYCPGGPGTCYHHARTWGPFIMENL